MQFSQHTFLGTTQSLCPQCLELVPAKILVRGRRVYFRKRCPTHGVREDFVCSDVDYYDRLEYSLPGKLPNTYGVEPDKGCPYDCGLCTEHEQHTCIALVEVTSNCNLTCPMCFAASAPGGKHLSYDECCRAIDRIVETEGRPEVIQLSGGEPTIHPDFERILQYALAQPVDYVTINTNGLRFAHDPRLVETVARHKDRLEVYFQFDGLDDDVSRRLRGQPLTKTKLEAIEILGRAGVHITLAVTLQGGVNDEQLGPLVEFALARRWITGISFQPATYSGRFVLPEELEQRMTFPDVIKGLAAQTGGLLRETDFMPLPCAHPNCHSLMIAYRTGDGLVPLARFFDARGNLDLLANGIAFTRPRARNLILQYLGRQGCCSGGCAPGQDCEPSAAGTADAAALPIVSLGDARGNANGHRLPDAQQFFARAVAEQLGAEDLFRITITSFLDAYNFDVRRLMKCCTHHVLPSGHVIPFCAYNVLYREGHVPLPTLERMAQPATCDER